MDVLNGSSGGDAPKDAAPNSDSSPARSGALSPARVGEALGVWQRAELRLARSFAECRNLTHEQLEDLYQETTLILLGRMYHSEEHLRNALRWGIRQRALQLHRNQRRREQILSQRTPELALAAEDRAPQPTPEHAAVHEYDRLIVAEFLTELSVLERRVFWLIAEGMRYRSIAPVLHISVNEARKVSRSCDVKRERFQLLYDSGRLCGFRAQTISALQAGDELGDELAQRAFAHLEACAHCRSEHRTNARRLRRSFQGQAAALLPIPVLAGRLGWLGRIDLRARALAHRLTPYGAPPSTGFVRERGVAMLASGGAAVKLAAGVATVAVLAGSTIGATDALHPHAAPRHHRTPSRASRRSAGASALTAPAPSEPALTATKSSAAPPTQRASSRRSHTHREPGGFAFLGVPGRAASASEPARAAAASTAARRAPAPEAQGETTRAGGPFSP